MAVILELLTRRQWNFQDFHFLMGTLNWQKFSKNHEGQMGTFLKFGPFHMEWPKRYFTSSFMVKLLLQNIRVWPWRLKWNISEQISFQTTIFVFINQPEIWWWEQHKQMTTRATFYPKQGTNLLQALILQTYGFAPLARWCHNLRKGIYKRGMYSTFDFGWHSIHIR